MDRKKQELNKYDKKLRRRKVSEAGKAWLFLLPSFLGVIFFVLLPFADVIRRSFCEAMSSRFVGLSNYRLVLHNAAFLLAVKNTGRFLLTCIPLLLVVSFILSLLLYYQKKYTEFFKMSFLLPMAIPVASVVLLWRLLFHENGLINVLLLHLGKEKIDFMNTSKAFLVLGFSYLWKNTGYNVILWLTGLNGISVNLYEAASVDGAGFFAKLRYITLPQLLPSVYVITILSFVNSFKVFREAYLVAGDYPHESIYMLQHLFNNWFVNLDVQKMSAAAVMCVVIFIILILLFKRIDRDGEED
jgi:multiple sugar transport system permease protein